MDFSFLEFLTSNAFVITWYSIGIFGALVVTYDVLKINTEVNTALKFGWIIIIIFFSILGLLLYKVTCRPPNIGNYQNEAKKEVHHNYVNKKWKKVFGSVMHCVGGDGLGIMTAMVISRIIGLEFWTEFWFEYAVGFSFGWFIFQYIAMGDMGNSPLMSLWKGGRAEVFSMMTVMLGMRLVMKFVTPSVVGHIPLPSEASFWGFGSLGLIVGTIFTYPMNWWLVSIKWKHGMA